MQQRRDPSSSNLAWEVSRVCLAVILAAAAIVRLIGIDSPLVGEHSHRQADTASIARNFHRGGYDFLRPEIDWAGHGPSVVESEFPLYPALVSLAYSVVGVDERAGRLLSVVFSVLSIALLWALAHDRVGEREALYAAAFLAVLPTYAFFGRVFMSEPLLLAASVGGVYFFSRWVDSERPSDFVLSAGLVGTACLVKLPALYLGAPLLYLATLRDGSRPLRQPALWIYGALVLIPVALWYGHARMLAVESGISFGIWEYGVDKWGNWEMVASTEYWMRMLAHRLGKAHLTYAGGLLFAIGLLIPRATRGERVFDFWLIGLLIYLIIVGGGNWAHNYYQLPVVLPAAVFMGKACVRFLHSGARRTASAAIVLIATLAVPAMSARRLARHHGREGPAATSELVLAEQVRLHSAPGALLVTADGDPTLLYLADRKGFVASWENLSPVRLERFRERGVTWVGGRRDVRASDAAKHVDAASERYPVVYEDAEAVLIRLDPPI